MNHKKYSDVIAILKVKYGSSTGFIPNHVRAKNKITRGQNKNLILFILLCCIYLFFNLRGIKIIIDSSKASTPPNLFGIDRKIAYANKKYHSG
jgi:hypothetical protein